MTTEELLEKLPKYIDKREVEKLSDDYDAEERECLIGFLKITEYNKKWHVGYFLGENTFYLGKGYSKNYAIFGNENQNIALQCLYDWCVKYKVIQ